MRLLKFLKESWQMEEEMELWNAIDKDCSKFIKQANETLYRGAYYDGDLGIIKADIRQDREPRGTLLHVHDLMNYSFKEVFGLPLRSCTLFCTGSRDVAEEYGDVYIIYPSNDFQVYWSPYVDDLLGVPDDAAFRLASPEAQMLLSFTGKTVGSWSLFESNCRKYPKLKELANEEFSEVLKTKNEEKIFRAVSEKYPDALIPWIRKVYKKGDINRAMRSGNEIMLDASFYYAVASGWEPDEYYDED